MRGLERFGFVQGIHLQGVLSKDIVPCLFHQVERGEDLVLEEVGVRGRGVRFLLLDSALRDFQVSDLHGEGIEGRGELFARGRGRGVMIGEELTFLRGLVPGGEGLGKLGVRRWLLGPDSVIEYPLDDLSEILIGYLLPHPPYPPPPPLHHNNRGQELYLLLIKLRVALSNIRVQPPPLPLQLLLRNLINFLIPPNLLQVQ